MFNTHVCTTYYDCLHFQDRINRIQFLAERINTQVDAECSVCARLQVVQL